MWVSFTTSETHVGALVVTPTRQDGGRFVIDTVSRFNPHSISADDVRALATGRDDVLHQVLTTVDANQKSSGSLQHVLLFGPRGIGKSFFMRWLQVTLGETHGTPPFVLLAEEQPNISTPAGLLDEIRRAFEGDDPATVMPSWRNDGPNDWHEAAERLNQAIRSAMPKHERPLVIIGIENLDFLVDRVFSKKADQSRFRKFLVECETIMIVGATLRTDLDQSYGERLFHSFVHVRLQPWSEDDFVDYFRKRCRRRGVEPDRRTVPRLRALRRYCGGSPRMAVILADLLEEGDPVSAAQALDALVDELTPYYQDLIDRMPGKPRVLFDALVRGGEPCSQSALAERIDATQSRIAQHFAWLRENTYVVGESVAGSRAKYYRVVDRMFVQFYRKRYFDHDAMSIPLSAMVELLETLFATQESWDWALRLHERGDRKNAEILAHVAVKTDDEARATSADWKEAHSRAMKASAFTEALAAAKKAALLADLDESGRDLGWARHLVGNSLAALGRYSEAISSYRVAVEAARDLEDESTLISSCVCLGTCLLRLGNIEESLAVFRDAVRLAEDVGDVFHQAVGLARLTQILLGLGRYDEALVACEWMHRLAVENDAGYLTEMVAGQVACTRWIVGDDDVILIRQPDDDVVSGFTSTFIGSVVACMENVGHVSDAYRIGARVIEETVEYESHAIRFFVGLLSSNESASLFADLADLADERSDGGLESGIVDVLLLAHKFFARDGNEPSLPADSDLSEVAHVMSHTRHKLFPWV